jgi:hypothetical protein
MRRSLFPSAWTTPVSKLTPQQCYRWIVIPIGGALIYGCVLIVVLLWIVRVGINGPFWPKVESDEVKRLIFTAIGVFWGLTGVGLCFKSRTAWLGCFGYFIAVGIWAVATLFLADPATLKSEDDEQAVRIGALIGAPFTAALAVVFYLLTKPAFAALEDSRHAKKEESQA